MIWLDSAALYFERENPNKTGSNNVLYILLSARRSWLCDASNAKALLRMRKPCCWYGRTYAVLYSTVCIFINETHSNKVQFVVRFQKDHTIGSLEKTSSQIKPNAFFLNFHEKKDYSRARVFFQLFFVLSLTVCVWIFFRYTKIWLSHLNYL